VQQLRQALADSQAAVASLQSELQARGRAAAAEQQRLAADNGALRSAVERLNGEVARLQGMRRSLLRQLQDDEGGNAAAGGGGNVKVGRG
jgi:hypothetical protein